jgi:hypothetical protein
MFGGFSTDPFIASIRSALAAFLPCINRTIMTPILQHSIYPHLN